MIKRKIGYGSPPAGKPFQPGKSGNSRGRPPRKPNQFGDIVQEVLDGPMEYRKDGKAKTAPRQEVSIKVWVDRALKGDVKAAEVILKKRAHALRHGQKGGRRVLVVNWLPDYSGQSGEQKAESLKGKAAGLTQSPVESKQGDRGQSPIADEPSPSAEKGS